MSPAGIANDSREKNSDEKPVVPSSHITLKVLSQDGNGVYFRVKKNIGLRNMMQAFSDKVGLNYETLCFLFDGKRINANQTPDELELDDGDEIDAMLHVVGGCGASCCY